MDTSGGNAPISPGNWDGRYDQSHVLRFSDSFAFTQTRTRKSRSELVYVNKQWLLRNNHHEPRFAKDHQSYREDVVIPLQPVFWVGADNGLRIALNRTLLCLCINILKTRIHSSRMHTAHSSSRRGGGVWSWSPSIFPLGVGLDLIPLNFTFGCGPGSDPPQFPPWLWAWIWSPSISPLAVGLDLIPLNFILGVGLEGVYLVLGGVPGTRGWCTWVSGGGVWPEGCLTSGVWPGEVNCKACLDTQHLLWTDRHL